MKRPGKSLRREVFVLTPDEKRAAACVVGAFLLGLATMQYRANHPRPAPIPTAKEQREAKRAASRTKAARTAPTPQGAPAAVERDASEIEKAGEDE